MASQPAAPEQPSREVAAERPKDPTPSRKIYVAKPGRDMRWAYLRIVNELAGRSYRVLPVPDDPTRSDLTIGSIDAALKESEASIHLIGAESLEDGGEPSKTCLQLARAARRAGEESDFERIIWVPKNVIDGDGRQLQSAERDPLAVVEQFTKHLESDKIIGAELSVFVEFVLQHLEGRSQRPPPIFAMPEKRIVTGSSVYVKNRNEYTEGDKPDPRPRDDV